MSLERRTGLKRTGFARGTVPLPQQRAPIARKTPMPQPRYEMTPEERHAKDVVRRRCGGVCEICLSALACDWSHRRSVAQGGLWRPANGLGACRPCHTRLEGKPLVADAGGWRIVNRDPDPATAPVYLPADGGLLGSWWFLDDEGGMTDAPWFPPPLRELAIITGATRPSP